MQFYRNILVVLLILFASPVFAADHYHYVSPTGTANWANSTDIAQPCSWSTAMANAAAGDTVYFRGGTYNLGTFAGHLSMAYTKMFPANVGTGDADNQRIIFKAYPGETPDITGAVAADSQENWFGCGSGGDGVSGSYVTWDGFSATMIERNPGSYETNIFSAQGIGCVARNMHLVGYDYYADGDNSNTSLIRIENCNGCLVENNLMEGLIGGVNNVGALWIFGGSNGGPNNTVRQNTIRNSSGGIFCKTGYDSPQIYRNFLYSVGDHASYPLRFNREVGSNTTATNVYQNVIVWTNSLEQGFIQIGPSAVENDANINFYNNTIYSPVDTGGSGLIFTNTIPTNLSIYNNVFYTVSRHYTMGDADVLNYSDYNIFGGVSGNSFMIGATPYADLAAWVSGTVYDGHSYQQTLEDIAFANTSGLTPEDYKISSIYKNNGRGGDYASVIGAYITGSELIGYQPVVNGSIVFGAGTGSMTFGAGSGSMTW